jgi:hypothetical protein
MKAHLPDELLVIIFEQLPQQALRDIRLLNRQWNAVSTPLVFERIHLSLLSCSLAKLSALSQSPLAEHVKAIDFHTEQLCEMPHGSYRKYAGDKREPFKCGSSKPTSSDPLIFERGLNPHGHYTDEQLDEGWKAYEACRGELDRRTGLVDCLPVPNDCLPRLRNLREVVADRIKPEGVTRIDATTYWNNLKRTILVNPFSRERFGNAIGSVNGSLPTSFLLMALGHRLRVEGVEDVESLTMEMPGYSPLDFIRYNSRFYGDSDDMELYDPNEAPWGARCQVVVDVFKRLKHLALICRGSREMDKYELIEYRESEHETVRLLKSATNLESLELEIDQGLRVLSRHHDLAIRDSPVDLVLSSLFTWATYPFLRELKIKASLHPQPFIDFLSWHKSTLRSLVMTDCIGYDWNKILDSIDQDLKLDNFRARFLWTRRFKAESVNADCYYIDFSGSFDRDDDDHGDWEDDRHDDYLEMFQGKPLLFDVPLNEKMGLTYEEFKDRFGPSRAAEWRR